MPCPIRSVGVCLCPRGEHGLGLTPAEGSYLTLGSQSPAVITECLPPASFLTLVVFNCSPSRFQLREVLSSPPEAPGQAFPRTVSPLLLPTLPALI